VKFYIDFRAIVTKHVVGPYDRRQRGRRKKIFMLCAVTTVCKSSPSQKISRKSVTGDGPASPTTEESMPTVCRHCCRNPMTDPELKDWIEHWFWITGDIDKISDEISELENKLNLMMSEKRLFQKAFQELWHSTPPFDKDPKVDKRCHGYVLDWVRNEKTKHDEEQTFMRAASSPYRLQSPKTTGKEFLRKVFSLSSRKQHHIPQRSLSPECRGREPTKRALVDIKSFDPLKKDSTEQRKRNQSPRFITTDGILDTVNSDHDDSDHMPNSPLLYPELQPTVSRQVL
jgi:hypothetical protein